MKHSILVWSRTQSVAYLLAGAANGDDCEGDDFTVAAQEAPSGVAFGSGVPITRQNGTESRRWDGGPIGAIRSHTMLRASRWSVAGARSPTSSRGPTACPVAQGAAGLEMPRDGLPSRARTSDGYAVRDTVLGLRRARCPRARVAAAMRPAPSLELAAEAFCGG